MAHIYSLFPDPVFEKWDISEKLSKIIIFYQSAFEQVSFMLYPLNFTRVQLCYDLITLSL